MQKLRINWFKIGDQDSKFFHTTVIIRRRKNMIDTWLDSNGEWNFDLVILKEKAMNFYSELLA